MQNRVNKIMKVIENNNLDAVALIAGPNMTYLTGADFHLMERPTVLIFSKNYKPVAILPNLEVDSFKALNFYKEVSDSHENIYNAEIISWKDSEGFNDAFIKAGETIGNLKNVCQSAPSRSPFLPQMAPKLAAWDFSKLHRDAS